MIRLTAFAFAKHFHFAKDAKRQWQWDVGQWDRDTRHTPVLLSCGARPCAVRARRGSSAVAL